MNLWRCDYCGHQQNAESRKCADCGGPRGEDNAIGEIVTWVGLNDEWYRGTLAGQREELNNRIIDVKLEIADAIIPALKKCADSFLGIRSPSAL